MSANESESVAKGNEDMYENISKMVLDRSLQFGWNIKETQT